MKNQSLDKLLAEYTPMVYRLALAKTGNADIAHDVAGQTFLTLLEKEPHFSDKEQLKVWLLATARKRAAMELRRFENSHTVPFEKEWRHGITDPLDFEFYDLLSKLPETLREVTVLFYIEDMSVKDIARTLSLTVTNVKTRLCRARDVLEKIYKEEIL